MPASLRFNRALPVLCTALLFAAFLGPAHVPAQALATAAGAGIVSGKTASSTSTAGPAGVVPAGQGFNASLTQATQHDSSNGWSTLSTPNLAYRFNSHLSADFSVPIYDSISVEVRTGAKAHPIYQEETKHGILGDSALAAHLDFSPSLFDYTLTTAVGLPTGKPAYGLGAGHPTYSITNHIEKSLGVFTPDFELGVSDSNNLTERRVRKSFTAVGAFANLQAGSSIDLPAGIEFEADGYEQLPLNTATIYSTTARGKRKVSATTGSAEDNGVLTSLDIPVLPHITFSASYDRSFRLRDDVIGFGLTFLLKPPPKDTGSVE